MARAAPGGGTMGCQSVEEGAKRSRMGLGAPRPCAGLNRPAPTPCAPAVSNRVSDTARWSLGQAAAACPDESGFIRT